MNDRFQALKIMPCVGALALLAGCQGGGTSAPPAPEAQKAPPAAAAKAPPSAAPTKGPAGATAAGARQTTASAPAPAAASPSAPAGFTYDPRGRRDPFRPLVVVRAPTARPKTGLASLDPAELKLTGIIWDQRGFYYALVEAPNGLGYVIRTNDVIGEEARVTKITPEGMTLELETRAELPRERGQKRLVEIRLRKEEEP